MSCQGNENLLDFIKNNTPAKRHFYCGLWAVGVIGPF